MQHALQRPTCQHKLLCCHTETEFIYQTCCFTQWKYTDPKLTSPSPHLTKVPRTAATILGELFAYATVFFSSNHRGSHIPSSWMVHAGCVFVASTHPPRTRMSGSIESVLWNACVHRLDLGISVLWNACVHRLDLGIYSYPKEILGNGVRTNVNSKGKFPSTRGSEVDGTQATASHRTVGPTHYPLSYSGPLTQHPPEHH